MDILVNILIPIAMLIVMSIIGTELVVDDFKRVSRYPSTIIIATCSQVLLLPLLAIAIIMTMNLSADLITALVIFSAMPGGGLSNVLTSLGKGNVALSITLTAIGCFVSLISIPLILSFALNIFAGTDTRINVPVLAMMAQLFFLVLVPIATGMWLREKKPRWVSQHSRLLKRTSNLFMAVILLFGFNIENGLSSNGFIEALPVAILFSCGALLIGYFTARLIGLQHQELIALVTEFIFRNTGIAILILFVVMDRPDLLVIPATCALVQLILSLLFIAAIRLRGRMDEGTEAAPIEKAAAD